MRGVAYALLAAGTLVFSALIPGSASADCYRDCGYRSGVSHHRSGSSHIRHVRYDRYERIVRRPVHHRHYRLACCDEGYRHLPYWRSRHLAFRHHPVIDSRPRYIAPVETLDDEDDLAPSYSSAYIGGYYDQPYYRPYYAVSSYPNGYYVSGTSGYGGGHRGLVMGGGYHRLGGLYGGHGFVGFHRASFGGFHGFHGHR